MTETLHRQACDHLIRPDGQEDLCFALWRPSTGRTRLTAIVHKLILPVTGDRRVHGNASFNPQYIERALAEASAEGCGLAFIHSHPHPGWQGMSRDDINAEQSNAPAVYGVTSLPLVGLTIGNDEAWSARFWEREAPRQYGRVWCATVRVVGEGLRITYMDQLAEQPQYREELRRTISTWGTAAQLHLARAHVGIVGAGSVGDIIAESVARTGFEDMTAIDFDKVERHNLDRLLHATTADIGKLKVDVLADRLPSHASANYFKLTTVAQGVNDEDGYLAALDCDVLFSCVDRPWARHILNFISMVHLIPVVDGGISVRTNSRGHLTSADWRAHISAPGKACLQCLGQYDPGLVEADRKGLLDDPSYIEQLPKDHASRRNENVFGFSMACAAQQFLQLIAYIVAPLGMANLGSQHYHFVGGFAEEPTYPTCDDACPFGKIVAMGDQCPIRVTGSMSPGGANGKLQHPK